MRPVGLRTVEANLVTQQQLGQPMARPHQIATQILARADQIPQPLLLDRRDHDPVQLTGRQQPHETLSIATIGLDPITRPPRDQPRRAHQTAHTNRPQPARQHELARPRLIRRHHRPRQPGHERHDVVTSTPH
jgi:hypothetical protein